MHAKAYGAAGQTPPTCLNLNLNLKSTPLTGQVVQPEHDELDGLAVCCDVKGVLGHLRDREKGRGGAGQALRISLLTLTTSALFAWRILGNMERERKKGRKERWFNGSKGGWLVLSLAEVCLWILEVRAAEGDCRCRCLWAYGGTASQGTPSPSYISHLVVLLVLVLPDVRQFAVDGGLTAKVPARQVGQDLCGRKGVGWGGRGRRAARVRGK